MKRASAAAIACAFLIAEAARRFNAGAYSFRAHVSTVRSVAWQILLQIGAELPVMKRRRRARRNEQRRAQLIVDHRPDLDAAGDQHDAGHARAALLERFGDAGRPPRAVALAGDEERRVPRVEPRRGRRG